MTGCYRFSGSRCFITRRRKCVWPASLIRPYPGRGIFITAYGRQELYKGIECFGKNIVYDDTDPCKGILTEEIKQKFDILNEKIIDELKQVLPDKLLKMAMPVDRKGNIQIIGTWDWETENHKYDRFKKYGSKKYIVESDNKTECTI